MCCQAKKKVAGLKDFISICSVILSRTIFCLTGGTKGVQELLGHADVSTTMNIYAHAMRKASAPPPGCWIR